MILPKLIRNFFVRYQVCFGLFLLNLYCKGLINFLFLFFVYDFNKNFVVKPIILLYYFRLQA
ncbi:MAG: hypothetical protein CVV39_04585 [Planctomycetes bacterium HGW-Planctomycetes-1]|nr:MAG: hypothetical protein CVV39_04585 [Planctomycetes bacterium HGW-Planctomycetes-1]